MLKLVRVEKIIGIEEAQNVALASCYAGIERGGLASVFFENWNDAVAVLGDDLVRIVGRSVIDHYDFFLGVILTQSAIDRLVQKAGVVIVVDEDTRQRPGHQSCACDIMRNHHSRSILRRRSSTLNGPLHLLAPKLKREPRTAAVADGPKALHENLASLSAYPTSPTAKAARIRQRTCDANATRIDSGQCVERNACTMSPPELFFATRSAIPYRHPSKPVAIVRSTGSGERSRRSRRYSVSACIAPS